MGALRIEFLKLPINIYGKLSIVIETWSSTENKIN